MNNPSEPPAPLTEETLNEITAYAAGYLGGKVRRYFDLLAGEVDRLRGVVHDCPTCGASCKQCRCHEAKVKRLKAMVRTFMRREVEVIGMEDSGFAVDTALLAQAEALLKEQPMPTDTPHRPPATNDREWFVRQNAVALVAGLEATVARQRAELKKLHQRQEAYRREREQLRKQLAAVDLAEGPYTPPPDGNNDGVVRDAAGNVVADFHGHERHASMLAAALNRANQAEMRADLAEEWSAWFQERYETQRAESAEAEHTVEALRAALAATEDHAAALQRFIRDPEKVVLEREQDGSATVTIQHLAVRAFAASFARTLGDAPNFVTLELQAEDATLVVTVQRKEGKSPAQVLTEMREERDRLLAWEQTLRHYLGMDDGDRGPSVGSLPDRTLPEAEAEVKRLQSALCDERHVTGKLAAERDRLAEEAGDLACALASFRRRIEEERGYKHWDHESGEYTFGKVLKWLDEALAARPEAPPA